MNEPETEKTEERPEEVEAAGPGGSAPAEVGADADAEAIEDVDSEVAAVSELEAEEAAAPEGAPEPAQATESSESAGPSLDEAEAEGEAVPADQGDPLAEAAAALDRQAEAEPGEPLMEEEAEEEVTVSEELEEKTEEDEDERQWYVVHCYSGYENKVQHNLEQRIETMGMKDRIFDIVVPTEEEMEVKEGKRRTVERRVFPGYILVQMIMDEDSWYVVRNTPGVTGFVGMGNEPTPLRPEEVSQIIKRMEAEAPRIKVTYKLGQKVRIIDGPFNDFIGTVDDIDMERAKVRVMVSFFGRETPVELDFLQVEKA